MGKQLADVGVVVFAVHLRAKTDAALLRALADNLVQARKRTAANKQNVRRVHADKLLVRIAPPTLRRHAGNRPLYQFQQRLLHALARHIARNRRAIRFARNLVNLVNIHNAALRLFHIKIAIAQQLSDNLLHILAHITRLSERGRIRHCKGHIQLARQRLRQQRFARASWANQQNIRFRQFHIRQRRIAVFRLPQTLVMVVHRHGKGFFRRILPDNMLVQLRHQLGRRGQRCVIRRFFLDGFLARSRRIRQHCRAFAHAFIANKSVVLALNQMLHFVFVFAAKGAFWGLFSHKFS